mmetsp:Transcript_48619/g.77776  ORF Transcript_48619/g.77776 Transcript_48619/m.77776 type:complete len:253 (+) Transcript_48619:21-779(+)
MSHISEIKQWAQTQENLDIYQIVAFLLGMKQRAYYPVAAWKLMAVIGLQIYGVIRLTTVTASKNGFDCPDSAICQGYNGGTMSEAWMAFFFCSFVSITCAEQLRNLGQYGMYQWGSDQPEFVSKIVVAIGFYANLIVLLLCWFCSTVIIFASKDLLDMVLNSVAVLFMISIDDEIITFSDYERVTTAMADYASKSSAEACLDKLAQALLKLQLLWSKPMICTAIVSILTLIPPVFTILCYGPVQYDTDCVAV